MTRNNKNNKIEKLLYFKGKISNNHINIKLLDEKDLLL